MTLDGETKEDSLKRLNISRGYVKGTITRFFNFASNEENVKISSLEALITKRDKLLSSYKEYEEYNREILALTSVDNEDIAEVENKYFHSLTVINENIKLKSTSAKSTPPELGSSGISKTKLPNIEIPSFTGKYCEYVAFIEIFRSVIHNDRSLDNVQKLYYLRSFLRDQPYELIKNLPFISESYDEELKILEERYFNKYKIVSDHVNTLLDLEKLPKYPNANDLRKFVSVVRQTLAALKNLDAKVETWGPILLGVLMRKLDLYSSRSYQLERDLDKEPTVEEFLKYIDKRALALENSDLRHDQEEPPKRLQSARQGAR